MELIKVFDDVLEDSMCQSIIEVFDNNPVYHKSGITSNGYNPDIKLTTDVNISDLTNTHIWKSIDDSLNYALNKHIHMYFEYMNSLNNHYKIFEDLQDTGFLMQKYNKNNGHFKYHHDFSTIYENNDIYYRALVYIFYLNDVDEGGETILWNDYKIKPKAGSLLFFPASWTYPHKGNVPISHDKYIVTGWLYAKI